MNNKRKIKRASILAVIIYIMINGFVWGLMKAYINSYNSINRDKLVMAQITDKPDGKEIKILGGSFIIPENIQIRKRYTPLRGPLCQIK